MRGFLGAVLAVLVLAVLAVTIHQGLVLAARDADGGGGVARVAADTCAACHGPGLGAIRPPPPAQ